MKSLPPPPVRANDAAYSFQTKRFFLPGSHTPTACPSWRRCWSWTSTLCAPRCCHSSTSPGSPALSLAATCSTPSGPPPLTSTSTSTMTWCVGIAAPRRVFVDGAQDGRREAGAKGQTGRGALESETGVRDVARGGVPSPPPPCPPPPVVGATSAPGSEAAAHAVAAAAGGRAGACG